MPGWPRKSQWLQFVSIQNHRVSRGDIPLLERPGLLPRIRLLKWEKKYYLVGDLSRKSHHHSSSKFSLCETTGCQCRLLNWHQLNPAIRQYGEVRVCKWYFRSKYHVGSAERSQLLPMWLPWKSSVNVFTQLRIRPGEVWACHRDNIAETAHNTTIKSVEFRFWGLVTIILWQSGI